LQSPWNATDNEKCEHVCGWSQTSFVPKCIIIHHNNPVHKNYSERKTWVSILLLLLFQVLGRVTYAIFITNMLLFKCWISLHIQHVCMLERKVNTPTTAEITWKIKCMLPWLLLQYSLRPCFLSKNGLIKSLYVIYIQLFGFKWAHL